jgi:HAD superfamily hydrolase (TIGR01509 family)
VNDKNIFDYSGALFDLDGTLLDSMHVWDHICRDWLAGKGKKPGTDLEKEIEIMSLSESTEYVIKEYGFTLSAAEIISQWEEMVIAQYQNSVPLKQKSAELVYKLYEKGAKLAIVTSCFPAACEAALKRHGLKPYFSAVIYTHELSRNKSYPDIWLAAADRLGLKPKDCIVFEDMYQAMDGARAAGTGAFAAVYDESCTDWQAMKKEADFYFE